MEILIARAIDYVVKVFNKPPIKNCDAEYIIVNKVCNCYDYPEPENIEIARVFGNQSQKVGRIKLCVPCGRIVRYCNWNQRKEPKFVEILQHPTTETVLHNCNCGKVYIEHFDLHETDFVELGLTTAVLRTLITCVNELNYVVFERVWKLKDAPKIWNDNMVDDTNLPWQMLVRSYKVYGIVKELLPNVLSNLVLEYCYNRDFL